MGHTIWIEVDGHPGSETPQGMSILEDLHKHLDALAEKLGVARLATFRALRRRLEEDFSALGWEPDKSTQHYPPELMKELRFCEQVLEEAVKKGQRFRLMIVP